MTRVQYLILTSLSCVVAVCLLIQLIIVQMNVSDENKLRAMSDSLQEGQLDYARLQQIANWTAQLADQQNDQALKDLLERQGIQIKPTASSTPTTTSPLPTSAAPAAR